MNWLFRLRLWLAGFFIPSSNQRLFRFQYSHKKWRAVDPVKICLLLDEHPKFIANDHWDGVQANDTESCKIVAETARDVFNVKEYDEETGEGLTIPEQIALMMEFGLGRWREYESRKSGLVPLNQGLGRLRKKKICGSGSVI